MNYNYEISQLQNRIVDLEELIERKNETIKKLYLEIEDKNCMIIISSLLGLFIYYYNVTRLRYN